MSSQFLSLLLLELVAGDITLHVPRGSNNKLFEQSNNVNNDERLFDSQNNARSGYQVGDACIPNCLNGNNQYQNGYPGSAQGVMQYYEGSYLWVDWTNQHGSQNPRLHTNVVIQYMCDDGPTVSPYSVGLRDGNTTATIPLNPQDPTIGRYGQHETFRWYDECRNRTRNRNLYTAAQNLQGNTARYTRQNNNGNRHGYECPEERDYYPYWHPNPWRDIWVCTDTPTMCPMYKSNSQNVRNFGSCNNITFNNIADCQNNRYSWTESGSWNQPAPNCTICPRTRNNQNANAIDSAEHPHYTWKIPTDVHADGAKCVIRIRYNITTKDFGGDAWNVFSNSNGANSKVKNNPVSDFVGFGNNVSGPIRLNINTAQFGRTFEDRSHVFQIRKRPSGLRCGIRSGNDCNIVNLNVRGRRGNIQETYPAVEYDFVPPDLNVGRNDYLHIQWTGADSNQQGNAGNGRGGTDRNNLVIMPGLGANYPTNINPIVPTNNGPLHFTNNNDTIARLAFLNQTECDDNTNDANNNNNCKQMNRAPGYYDFGLVQVENVGTFYYMSTRNNAFSNREQKNTLIVTEDGATIGGAIAIAVVGLGLIGALGVYGHRYAKRNPDSKIAAMYMAVGGKDYREYDSDADSLDDRTPTILDKYPFLAGVYEWYAWNQPQIMFVIFFVCCQLGSFMFGVFIHLNTTNPAPYFPYAKGFGKMLDFNMSFILLPILRNFLSYLRTTAAAEKLPLDDNIKIHKWTAYTAAFAATGHITMHMLNYVFMQNWYAVPLYESLLFNVPGPTGLLVTFIMIIMYSAAFLKRKIYNIAGRRFDGYRTFLMLHRLYIPVYGLLWIHGSQFWQFSVFPLLFLFLEKFIQSRRTKMDVSVVEAKMVGKDTLALKMQLVTRGKSRFRYKAGQYLFLCCPEISETEYHPFTITSAPEENFFSCHIRCRKDMDWTYKLRETLGFGEVKREQPEAFLINKTTDEDGNEVLVDNDSDSPLLRVDGPYGSASEEVFDYETVVLVGAGIGVTPFISIMKSFAMRIQAGQKADMLTIYFYWMCRDQAEFDSFAEFFDQILKIKELSSHLELNLYVTGEMNLQHVKQQAYNQFSGRPNWNRIFKEKKTRHEGTEIGVFLCGPAAVAQELAVACKKNSSKRSKAVAAKSNANRTIFKFSKENF